MRQHLRRVQRRQPALQPHLRHLPVARRRRRRRLDREALDRARVPAEELHLDRNVAEAEAAPLQHAAHLVHQRLRLRGLDDRLVDRQRHTARHLPPRRRPRVPERADRAGAGDKAGAEQLPHRHAKAPPLGGARDTCSAVTWCAAAVAAKAEDLEGGSVEQARRAPPVAAAEQS